jgi:hypothetical protein
VGAEVEQQLEVVPEVLDKIIQVLQQEDYLYPFKVIQLQLEVVVQEMVHLITKYQVIKDLIQFFQLLHQQEVVEVKEDVLHSYQLLQEETVDQVEEVDHKLSQH